MAKQKLELTWIGKENRPKLEPRILLEDPVKSYHAKFRSAGVPPAKIFDNRLIFGDNLLALKALESEFAGKVKCVFIDPPYNTGSAFTHYDDGLERSIWLSMMRDRLEIIRRLLSEDGSLWTTIDDNEAHYLKVMCDEVFGRANFVANVLWQKRFSPNSHQVHLVGHQTIRPHLYPTPRTPLRHQAKIGPVILVSEKRRLPAIPSLRDVVRKTGGDCSCDPCHGAKLRRRVTEVKN